MKVGLWLLMAAEGVVRAYLVPVCFCDNGESVVCCLAMGGGGVVCAFLVCLAMNNGGGSVLTGSAEREQWCVA